MKFDFGFRVDLGNKVGSGHFFRCLSIAEKLIEKGFKIIFIVNDKLQIEYHLENKDMSYHVIEHDSELEKINECKILLKDISKLIIDLPFKNEMYSELLKNHDKIIVIDDLGNKKIFSQLLFNGSIVDDFQKYTINENLTKYFFGSKYLILRSQFKEFRKQIVLKKEIKKILLIFGGNDDKQIAEKILPYFFNKKYEITIVVGPSNNNQEKINKLSQNQTFKIIYVEHDIAHLFSKQDLVISSAGMTTYELACLGIPSILIPVDKYQMKTAESIEKIGFGINYGYWDDDLTKFDKIFSDILNYSVREKMYISGRKIVDGEGVSRILEKICKI